MSRMIKVWPYNEMYNDKIECDAASINDFELPGVRMQCFNFESDKDEISSFRTVARAEEERKGIFLRLVEEDAEGNLTEKKSEEIVVDEIEFVDAIYGAVEAGNDTAEDSEYIQQKVLELAQNYAMSELSGGKWYFKVDYVGFGVICTNDDVIGTINSVKFDKDAVILDYCVGNIDLNQVDNCNVRFSVGGKCFRLTNFNMESVVGHTENLCTYTLKNYHGEIINELPADKEQIDAMIPYSQDKEEEFIAQRMKLIGSNDFEDNFFSDDIGDLL